MSGHWFEPLAEHLGSAYLRYSFTKGTEQEVAFLSEALGLRPGQRVLDVGCGPGRHAHALARAGLEVVGVDVSQRFVELARADAPPGATFRRLDARALPFESEFDAAISLCQGAFGLSGGPDTTTSIPVDGDRDAAEGGDQDIADAAGGQGYGHIGADVPGAVDADVDGDTAVLAGIARALRPGGVAAVSAFSAYFQVRWLEGSDRFDADRGVNHELTEVRDEYGTARPAELWTTCYTPRELRLLAEKVGLRARAVWSVEPGRYVAEAPTVDTPEFLLLAARVP